ncbi:MAG: hypothetical protein ABH950_02790 [Candidatus Altiarchaeota archaeon]
MKKKKKLILAGETIVLLPDGSEILHVVLARSITWILRVTRRDLGEINIEGAIGVIRKRGLKYETKVGKLLRKEIFDRFNDAIITNTVIFNIYQIECDFKDLVNRFQKDPDLPDHLGLPRGKSSVSVIGGDKLAVFMQTRFHHIPYWFILFQESKNPPEVAGIIDYPFDGIQIPICRAIFNEIDDQLLELIRKIHGSSSTIFALQQGEFGLVETSKKIQSSQWNLMQCREMLFQLKTMFALVSQHLNESIDNLERYNEVVIYGGVNNSLQKDIRSVEQGVGTLINQTENQQASIRQTLEEIVRNETLRRLERSIQEEKRMAEVLQSSHSIHSAMFIVELVLFAELYEGIMDSLPFFEQLKAGGETAEILLFHGIAIILGVASSVLLTRMASQTKLYRKLFIVDKWEGIRHEEDGKKK